MGTAASSALSLLRNEEVPRSIVSLLEVPGDPTQEAPTIELNIEHSDLVHLREGATSGNDWLFVLAYDWLEEAGMSSTLWEVLLDMSPPHRLAAGAHIAQAANREDAAFDWLVGSDPSLRIVGARLLARKPDVTPDQLQALAQDDNGAVRAALFAELTEQGNLLELDRLRRRRRSGWASVPVPGRQTALPMDL